MGLDFFSLMVLFLKQLCQGKEIHAVKNESVSHRATSMGPTTKASGRGLVMIALPPSHVSGRRARWRWHLALHSSWPARPCASMAEGSPSHQTTHGVAGLEEKLSPPQSSPAHAKFLSAALQSPEMWEEERSGESQELRGKARSRTGELRAIRRLSLLAGDQQELWQEQRRALSSREGTSRRLVPLTWQHWEPLGCCFQSYEPEGYWWGQQLRAALALTVGWGCPRLLVGSQQDNRRGKVRGERKSSSVR